ncbi:MAG: hypothetical protein AABO58_24800 [Acidobacteriota bacterium]
MPMYQWTGRTRSGEAQSGSLEASSKEAAIAALRAGNILVNTITERMGSTRRGGAGRIAVGLLLLGGAFLMAMIAKGTRIHCTRTAAAYDCTVETTMAGFHVLYAEDIRGARNATDEKKTSDSYDSKTRTRSTSESHRLMLAGATSTVASEWMAHPLASCDWVSGTLNENFAKRQAPSFETWQVETPPAAVALVIAITGLFLIASGVRRIVGIMRP